MRLHAVRRALAARSPACSRQGSARWASSTASSSGGAGGDDTSGLYSTDTNALIGRTLYRQLTRWCKTVGGDIPMSHLIPPVSLTAPRIDGEALKRLSSLPTDERGEYIVGTSSSDGNGGDQELFNIHNMLPKDAIVDDNLLICPVRRAVPDLIGLIRAVYRINSPNFAATAGEGAAASPATPSDIKERVNLGFEATRSLNELTEVIDHMKKQRKEHRDRSGVDFHVGQVVQHKGDRWRGIVVGWRRGPTAPMQGPGGGSSLTTKDYGTPVEKDTSATMVRYDVIVDTGDAHLLGGKRNVDAETGFPLINQVDLEAVDDPLLMRVRSHWTNSKMDRFDSQQNQFIPNDFVRYEYPADCDETGSNEGSSSSPPQMVEATDEIASAVIGAVRDFAGHLHKNILEMTPSPETRGNTVISSIRERLLAISSGSLTDPNDVASLMTDNMSLTSLAAMHLQQVLEICLEVSEMSWQRHIALKDKEKIRFSLGTIVRHKKYGFRGVSDCLRVLFSVCVSHLYIYSTMHYLLESSLLIHLLFALSSPDPNTAIVRRLLLHGIRLRL